MVNSLKCLLNGIFGYASEGNDIIVKTLNIVLIVRQFDSSVSWIAIYKKKKITLISEIGETDIVFQSLTSFINDVDKESNDADNS